MSGIQHFAFCRRQWALIHIEQQWQENARTAAGQLDHIRCHDEAFSEKRGEVFTVRGMRVFSRKLNLSGSCDVVEFHKDENGISLQNKPDLWLPYPVEYKHGCEKETDADRLQLCAEAMALEEMLVCDIPAGALYYVETRRREVVPFTEELRRKTEDTAAEMNRYFARGYTPKVKPGKHCNACSLKSICLPVLCSRADPAAYLKAHIFESEEDTP